MADIVGNIAPEVEITETEAFDAPTRTVNLTDATGRLRGRIQWLAEDINPATEQAVLQFYVDMRDRRNAPRRPGAAS